MVIVLLVGVGRWVLVKAGVGVVKLQSRARRNQQKVNLDDVVEAARKLPLAATRLIFYV